jgi:hypothetical protein
VLRSVLRWAAFGSLRPRVAASPLRRNMLRAVDSSSTPVRGIGYTVLGVIAARRLLSGRDSATFSEKLKPGESISIETRRPGRNH